MNSKDGEDGQTLLVVNVTEDTWDSLLAFGVGEDGNKRMRACWAEMLLVAALVSCEPIQLTSAEWAP